MILDTNALSAFADGDEALSSVLAQASAIAIPAIVLGEYLYGIRQSRYRSGYERWLSEQVKHWDVLAVDQETAGTYADVRSELKRTGKPVPANDVWIAALARQHRMPLLSRDRHFDLVPGMRRVDW